MHDLVADSHILYVCLRIMMHAPYDVVVSFFPASILSAYSERLGGGGGVDALCSSRFNRCRAYLETTVRQANAIACIALALARLPCVELYRRQGKRLIRLSVT